MIKENWKENLDSELQFWRKVIQVPNSEWHGGLIKRVDPNTILRYEIAKYCKIGEKNIILDVGSGPLTILGKKHDSVDFKIIPIDPLAEEYNEMLSECNFIPPIVTIKLDGEKLTTMFEENTFDITHARNSIDHSYDPIEIINQMILVTKPGGHIILTHHIRSELHDRFNGLHNWNFFTKNNHFMIRGQFMDTVDVNNKFENKIEMVELYTTIDIKCEFTVVFRKK